VWEYLATQVLMPKAGMLQHPPYHQNDSADDRLSYLEEQTLYFGDIEANRISIAKSHTTTVRRR